MYKQIFLIIIASLLLLNCSNTIPADPEQKLPDLDKLWNYDDPVLSELSFREILIDVNFETNPKYHLELRTQLARSLGLQQKFDEAHEVLDQVAKDLTTADTIPRIRYLLERGRAYNSAGQSEKSKTLFVDAWDLAKGAKADFYAVDAAHMMGIVEAPENQLVWNNKAMTVAENSFDPRARKWLGALYNNIGWTYHDMDQYETALQVFEKSLRWRELNKQVRQIQIAEWCVARTHRSLGNIQLALDSQLDLEKQIAESGGAEDGYVFEEIAECLLLLEKSDEAKPYFQKAWELLSEDIWLQKNEADRLARLKELGEG